MLQGNCYGFLWDGSWTSPWMLDPSVGSCLSGVYRRMKPENHDASNWSLWWNSLAVGMPPRSAPMVAHHETKCQPLSRQLTFCSARACARKRNAPKESSTSSSWAGASSADGWRQGIRWCYPARQKSCQQWQRNGMIVVFISKYWSISKEWLPTIVVMIGWY